MSEEEKQGRSLVAQAKRVVVKVGTSSITYPNGRMKLRNIDHLADGTDELLAVCAGKRGGVVIGHVAVDIHHLLVQRGAQILVIQISLQIFAHIRGGCKGMQRLNVLIKDGIQGFFNDGRLRGIHFVCGIGSLIDRIDEA